MGWHGIGTAWGGMGGIALWWHGAALHWGGIPLGWHGEALHCGSMGYVCHHKGIPSKPAGKGIPSKSTGKGIPSQSTTGAYHVMPPHAATRESHPSLPQGHPIPCRPMPPQGNLIQVHLKGIPSQSTPRLSHPSPPQGYPIPCHPLPPQGNPIQVCHKGIPLGSMGWDALFPRGGMGRHGMGGKTPCLKITKIW